MTLAKALSAQRNHRFCSSRLTVWVIPSVISFSFMISPFLGGLCALARGLFNPPCQFNADGLRSQEEIHPRKNSGFGSVTLVNSTLMTCTWHSTRT